MRPRLVPSFISVVLAGALLMCSPTTSLACGPFELEAIFTFTVHPEFPLARFAGGEIGVIQPSYARSYLFVGYRHLIGAGFNEQEQKSLTELWKDRLESNWNLGDQEWIKEWLAVRQKVPGVVSEPHIEVYRNREKPNEFETYLNCQKDAFQSAALTLTARIAKYGADSPAIKEWVLGQDQVFGNCSKGQEMPQAQPDSADQLFRADRTYQIAAANFYAGNFDNAKKTFEEIVADNSSPWQSLAPYLIARTLVRKASLGAAELKHDTLSAAEKQLNSILTNRRLDASHPAAARLLDVVRNRLHPAERLHELAKSLLAQNQTETLKQEVLDYTLLLDDFLETDESEKRTTPTDELLRDDLTDWIATFQSPAGAALDHSLAKWQATHTLPWLVASISKISSKHSQASALISASLGIKANSPAFPATRFHVARLLIESGRTEDARALLDELLKNDRSRFDESSLNLLTSKRMLLARSLAEFLSSAPRVPAGFSWNDDGREVPTEASELPEESKGLLGKSLFDKDATHVLNLELPLVVLREAAKSTALPSHLHRDVAQAVWLRAVLLGDNRAAEELAPTLKGAVPELSPLLDGVLSASQPEAKKFAAIYAWLKFPGLEPVVDQGVGRQIPLGQQDVYRDNWWCAAASSSVPNAADEEDNKPKPFAASTTTGAPLFLTEEQRTAAAREHAVLGALGAAPNYLCQQVIQWATKNPTDQRVPEALHLAVNTTRHGCTDSQTGRWSKAAFDLLHRKYTNTTWAKKTPYWFKD